MVVARRHRKWDAEELKKLLAMKESGQTFKEMAIVFGRTYKAVEAAYRDAIGKKRTRGDPVKRAKIGTTVRHCLCCKKKFRSEGPHNRMCTDCRRLSNGPLDEEAKVLLR